MKYNSALLSVFSLISSFMLSQYAGATSVTVNGVDCGNFTSLNVTPDQVSLVADGTCTSGNGGGGGGGGANPDTPSNVLNRTIGSVTEGESGSIDVSTGLAVQLPYTVSVTQPGLAGASASVSGSQITYHAPPAGTVSADGTPDSFTYTVTDSSAAPNSVTATINVTVNKGNINANNGACVNSSTILCKTPELDISQTGGEFRYVDRSANITHVWTIPPGKRISREANIGVRYVTAPSLPVTISLSDNYAADSSSAACTRTVNREDGFLIWYSEILSYRCLLDPAKTYYFRISGAKAGTYWLVW